MTLIRLHEHATIQIGAAFDAVSHTVTPAQARALVRASAQTGALRFVSDVQLKASEVVGVVIAGGAKIEILPKIDGLDESGARLNLVRMLIQAGVLPFDAMDVDAMDWRRTDLLDAIMRSFIGRLESESRRGLSRRYIPEAEDLPKLRGRLDVVRQYGANASMPHRLACRFDEFSVDVPMNRAFRCALELTAAMARTGETRRRAITCLALFEDVTAVPASHVDWARIQLDRTNMRFRTLLSLTRLLLSGLRQTTGVGVNHGFALLFDMNELFEAYVGRHMVRAFPGQVRLQGPRDWAMRDKATGAPAFETRPDIVVSVGDQKTLIDTKWKRLDESKRLLGIKQDDLYQMMAYAQVYRLRRLVLLYPWHFGLTGLQWPRRFVLSGSDAELEIDTLALDDLSKTPHTLKRIAAPALVSCASVLVES